MAITQTTCALRGNETLLSKRVFLGNTRPNFRSNFARWTDDGSSETRLAFDVTWDGPQSPENAFQGYSILVALGKERLEGDLVLLIRPEMEDLALALVDGDSFVDACSHSRIAAGAKVLGRVVAERQFLTEEQLFKKAKAFKIAEFAQYASMQADREREQRIIDGIDSTLSRAREELATAVAYVGRARPQHKTTVFWEFARALEGSSEFLEVQSKFREEDAEVRAEPRCDLGSGHFMDLDVDLPLKELVSLVFRAGQYSGPEHYMLDPEPTEYEAVEQLIAKSVRLARDENDRESTGGNITEPLTLTSIDLCSALTGTPAFQDERDRFRKADVPESRWPEKLTEHMDEGDFDYPLRSMLGRWFRAGMLAARTLQEPMQAQTIKASSSGDSDKETEGANLVEG